MNVFNSVKGLHPKRNAFSAHTYRNDFTAYMGLNVPVYQQHVVPGTRVKLDASALVRLQALISPVMDNIDYYVHFWQIPYRLLENDRFTAFISGEILVEEYDALFVTPSDFASEFASVYSEIEDDYSDFISCYNAIFGNGGIFDFLGYDKKLFPSASLNAGEPQFIGGNNITKFNFRPLIAYFMLHEHWYMNENVPYFNDFVELVDKVVKDQDLSSLCSLLINMYFMQGFAFLPHGWDKDYFTSALPNVQYGDPVTIGLAGSAPVSVDAQNVHLTYGNNDTSGLEFKFYNSDPEYHLPIGESQITTESVIDTGGHVAPLREDSNGGMIQGVFGKLSKGTYSEGNSTPLTGNADLSEVSVISINELRFANALQVFKERQMRFGRRRLEHYKGFFDVTPEDLRLQVPKYLGGGRIPINIADIEQTSANSGSQVLGHLAGKGTAVAGGFAGFTTFCSEESIIIGIAFSMPHQTYANATSKMLMKTNDPYDYFNPSFEHLGEQPINNIEIYSGAQDPVGEFGYTPRYNEYRFHLNEMHGEFKNSLSYWTLGRIFNSQPALNADFVYMQPKAFNRIFAVNDQPNLLVSMLFRVRLIQPVSKYGTPMLIC